jgi:hypothetical protein
MKSEVENIALTPLRLRGTEVAELEAAIRELEVNAGVLDREIKAEESRTRITDASHPTYSNLARSAIQRRDNLRSSASTLKMRLEEVMRDLEGGLKSADARRAP